MSLAVHLHRQIKQRKKKMENAFMITNLSAKFTKIKIQTIVPTVRSYLNTHLIIIESIKF